ncbi:WD repeat-containing protein 55 isoform X2 [Octopus bimaculoides]|uniref:Anaphase-promoting complex subunit 4 WD40 domain-containing protein n=1 Tax=Octopus bimaculoides TaxID=37653 RepID=A0A0L8IGH3_OCTBM|nr:WD repeat-containing protein 55 isoform X2 [Octopus bimaculoides]|eukprot:XP_014791044.1 PREDICTED: WD repeat-containing protein 55-like isoform X2 [Octopus bimaculoides]
MADPSTSQGDLKPKAISLSDVVVDVCFNPVKDVIAAAHIGGDVSLHSYSVEGDNQDLLLLEHHKKSCRCIQFSSDGNILYSGSKDKSVAAVDMNTGAVTWHKKTAHESAIYSLLLLGDHFLASGDDDGTVKVWDLRAKEASMELKCCEEFISGMSIDDAHKILLAASGEGTLTALNVRRKRLELQSELFDSELLSVAIIKNGRKVVCGTGEGVLNLFNWSEFGNLCDRFPGHPMSIDCICPISEDIICTGSLDGAVRAVHILPNRFLGVLGRHADFPVENLSLSRDKKFLASCSHDQTVKFWNLDILSDVEVNIQEKAKKSSRMNPLNKEDNFFADFGNELSVNTSVNPDSDSESESFTDMSDIENAGSENEQSKKRRARETDEESIEISDSDEDDISDDDVDIDDDDDDAGGDDDNDGGDDKNSEAKDMKADTEKNTCEKSEDKKPDT